MIARPWWGRTIILEESTALASGYTQAQPQAQAQPVPAHAAAQAAPLHEIEHPDWDGVDPVGLSGDILNNPVLDLIAIFGFLLPSKFDLHGIKIMVLLLWADPS